jgi:hypothetical protein
MRAEQLLALYRSEPQEFTSLVDQYKSAFNAAVRAPHRLAAWLKRDDLLFRNCDDIRIDDGKRLAHAFERPEFFNYRLNITPDQPSDMPYFLQASPAALGTLTYIAFETRRLFDEMKPKGEKFRPLEVTSLVEPEDYAVTTGQSEGVSHCSGQVFDIRFAGLPPGELECLRFILDDLGWNGYLGFVDEQSGHLHIGCAPTARQFFTTIYQEALGKYSTDQVSRHEGSTISQNTHVSELQ